MCHASKHMKCTIQVHELVPPTCVLKILIDPIPLLSLPLCQVFPLSLISLFLFPLLSFHNLSTLISLFFSPCTKYLFFSPFVINDHKGSKCRQVEIINVNQWGENHFSKFGPIQFICQRYLTQFDPRTSFFKPLNKSYLLPC